MLSDKRLIDVNVPIRDLTAMKSMYDAIALDGIIKALKEAPTVDAVEVCRCKDCKHSEPSVNAIGEPSYCCNNSDIGFFEWLMGEDDFCSYGERRSTHD